MMTLGHILKRIKQELIQRKTPYAILSWRYLLPGQSIAVRRHRAVLLGAWPKLPRPVWWALALLSYGRWYFWFGWAALYRAIFKLRKHEHNTAALSTSQGARISAMNQAAHLLLLTFAHAIPPHFYYQYRLYRYPRAQWLNFVFTHELPYWHHLLSPNVTDAERKLMTNKAHFSKVMTLAGLPAIATIKRLKLGEIIDSAALFQQQSLFIKPLAGSQKRDCYTLRHQSTLPNYALKGPYETQDLLGIKQTLQTLANAQPLLLQPLLENHAALAPYCPDGMLATIRLVTLKQKSGFKALSAVLEIPMSHEEKTIMPYPIDCETGELGEASVHTALVSDEAILQGLEELPGMKVPHWCRAIEVAEAAHSHLPNIYGIGWDLAITPVGVALIEGNVNWGVAGHQHGGLTLANLNLCE